MIKVVVSAIHGAIYGAIVGLIWRIALGTIVALYASVTVGVVLGVLVGLMGVAASSNGSTNDRESTFVAGSLLMLASMLAGVVGLMVWGFRALFF